jgi:hypothetical protein
MKHNWCSHPKIEPFDSRGAEEDRPKLVLVTNKTEDARQTSTMSILLPAEGLLLLFFTRACMLNNSAWTETQKKPTEQQCCTFSHTSDFYFPLICWIDLA